ncbi:superoxide dismutase [Candidatus Woesearchaeota archaeon]|nr:superoxide dismutase [Candidatus Woesearchaeota archaeon]
MTHTLPQLGYEYNALEPFIDEQTMRVHHTKHHQAYVDKLNAALQNFPDIQGKTAEELVTNLKSLPKEVQEAVENHGGGHVNHSFFWQILKKDVQQAGAVVDAITKKFKSVDKFKEQFTAKALNRFGSGWAWLVLSKGKLKIVSTANQESPLTKGQTPLLGIDVWEHAYYKKYEWRRAEYVAAFFSVVNWEKVNEHFEKAKAQHTPTPAPAAPKQ